MRGGASTAAVKTPPPALGAMAAPGSGPTAPTDAAAPGADTPKAGQAWLGYGPPSHPGQGAPQGRPVGPRTAAPRCTRRNALACPLWPASSSAHAPSRPSFLFAFTSGVGPEFT